MYCRHCYAQLTAMLPFKCPHCGRAYDPIRPGTFSRRPFPSVGRVISGVLLTTAFGTLVAWIVALHQLAARSGH